MSGIIFEQSRPGCKAHSQVTQMTSHEEAIPSSFLRQDKPILPELSELEVVRHYTRLSQKNFSIDTHFYPLGSCTMKYNPRGVHKIAMSDAALNRHPLASSKHSQGFLACMYELQEDLKAITGLVDVSLTPMAGAHGEWAGVAMIKAYHHDRKDFARKVIIVPDAAHGTNPASAVMCGFEVREIPTAKNGDIDLDVLAKALGPDVAGIMLTNPSTLGVFERNIIKVAQMVHEAGGLLYYDGANLNAILGKVRPGDMGFDVMHMNVHKTFATPHGGGGPGAGPIAVSKRLAPYLPIPSVIKEGQNYRWSTRADRPKSIGRMSAFMGNAGILLRAHLYIRLLGKEGLKRVGEIATLNANYLLCKLQDIGYEIAYPNRRASHEFIITLAKQAKEHHVIAMDVAKRLLDYGIHSPTTYFPLLIPECLLIEPTETESLQTLDKFIHVMSLIMSEINENPEIVQQAPHHLPVRRIDDVKAARQLDLTWKQNLNLNSGSTLKSSSIHIPTKETL